MIWHPITDDDLPLPGERVLVWLEGFVDIARLVQQKGPNYRYWLLDDDCVTYDGHVSYWAPMPEGPK